MSQNIDKKLAERMKVVRQRRVFDRVIGIIKEFGRYRTERLSSCHSHRGSFLINAKGAELVFSVATYGQFHENTRVRVEYGGHVMFEARETMWKREVAEADPRRVIKKRKQGFKASHAYVIDTFRPGLWLEYLNKQFVRRALKPKPEPKAKPMAKRHPEPVRELDYDLARRFAITDQQRR